MNAIYGSTRQYTTEITGRKLKQLGYRGNVNTLDMDGQSIAIVLDGNFYNQSDSLCVSHLYQQHGIKCLQHLNGDFAFVLFDPYKQILFGAVDRLGIKPLFYSVCDGFEFSSQLLPLCIGNNYQIDSYARQCYFALQYVPAPYSIINGVKKMKAGEYFIYDLKTKKLNIDKYWDLYDNTSAFTAPKMYEEAVETAQALIGDAVKIRLSQSQKNGLFLSGGIDSSLISLFASRNDNSLETYSVAFDESGFDESVYSQQVSQHLGLVNHRVVCNWQKAQEIMQNLNRYYDEPMGDASAIPTSFLCETVGKDVSVALGGDGGDEVFFGYPRYLRYAKRAWVYNIPKPCRTLASNVVSCFGKKREALSLRMEDVQTLYVNRRKSYPAELFDAVNVQRSIDQYKYLYGNPDVRRAFNDFDIKSIMCYELNVKMDRAGSRGRLDARSPLLDYRLVEYSRLIPIEFLYNNEYGQKRILREILYNSLPRELFERAKRGFGVPIGNWFRHQLKEYLVATLNQDAADLLPEYNIEALTRMRDDHINGKADYSALLWLVVNYIEWYKLFVEVTRG